MDHMTQFVIQTAKTLVPPLSSMRLDYHNSFCWPAKVLDAQGPIRL